MGFDGQPFEFQGFHNGVFTLVTHRRNEVNVLLNDLGHTDATFITAVAIVHPGNRVAVSIDNGAIFESVRCLGVCWMYSYVLLCPAW